MRVDLPIQNGTLHKINARPPIPMKLRTEESHEPRFFVRKADDSAERGPYTLEGLQDLFEFGHLTAASLIRNESATDWRRLDTEAELLHQICPEKERLHMGAAYQAEDKESHLRPVNVSDLYQCADETDDDAPVAEPAPRQVLSLHQPAPQSSPEAESELSVQEALRQSLEKERAARLRDSADATAAPAEKLSRFVTVFRWGMMLAFVGSGFWIWLGVPGSAAPSFVFDFLIGLVLVVFGMIWILPEALRIVTIPFNLFFDTLLEGSDRGPTRADFTRADSHLARGERIQALLVYRQIIEEFPRELAAYTKAYRLSRELGQVELARSLHQQALRNLKSSQDRNLFKGSTKRIDCEIRAALDEAELQ